jgi:hypothetical protein
MAVTKKTKPEEKIVQAYVVKHTSVAGRLLIAGTTVPLPLSQAKRMREGGTVRPVTAAVESHPKPPPPKPVEFDGEDEEDIEPENDEEDDEDEGEVEE